ncbi:MAG: L-aspartate oxidase [Clostridia bacterium BRH_c25]|nr:MAG: L-aspartate oxidase [Clostridia bacterium BRH_c25]
MLGVITKMIKHDVIIVGSGLAALATAARLYELGETNIALYTMAYGGTPYIAAINFVLPDNIYGDTPQQYFEDMIYAGYEINNKKLVESMTSNTYRGYELLKRWDVEFAKEKDGATKLRHVSGHTYPRSLCCTTNLIGVEIIGKMVKKLEGSGVEIHRGCQCVKVLTQDGKVYGITVKDDRGGLFNAYAPVVVAAWGGVGNLFGKSTYPQDIKGETLAIAKIAGAKLVDIEFLEYEPMVVLSPEGAVGEPCPTAMLGEGAYLLNAEGERFMLKVRPEGEAGSPKTLINKEIWKQVDAGKGTPHGGAFVDLRHISQEVLKGYPWFYNRLMENGVDPNKETVEVGPMAHSFSGGIYVDENYESSVEGFYAVGEACGGVHGACRCAGNAASQATLSGLLCAEGIMKNKSITDIREFPVEYAENKEIFKTYVPLARDLAVKVLGIYRNGEDLQNAFNALAELLKTDDLKKDSETYHIVVSIMLMIQAALLRRESRGTHMRIDYPDSQAEYMKEMIL